MTDDPYRRGGLRGNPFAHPDGAVQEAAWAASWVDVGLPDPGGRCLVQVIGVKGAGKTTTLRRWHARTPQAPWHYAPLGAGCWRPPPVAPLAFWDEADRAPSVLAALALRRAVRRGAMIVAGTHADLEAVASCAGLPVARNAAGNTPRRPVSTPVDTRSDRHLAHGTRRHRSNRRSPAVCPALG